MLQILPKNIIPITEARGKLDDLVREAKGENFFVISQQGKTKAAVIDVDYLLDLQKKVDMAEMERAHEAMKRVFDNTLKREVLILMKCLINRQKRYYLTLLNETLCSN